MRRLARESRQFFIVPVVILVPESSWRHVLLGVSVPVPEALRGGLQGMIASCDHLVVLGDVEPGVLLDEVEALFTMIPVLTSQTASERLSPPVEADEVGFIGYGAVPVVPSDHPVLVEFTHRTSELLLQSTQTKKNHFLP